MTTVLPISSSCHALQLPSVEKDDRLNLNVRTGSASTLYNSFIFTYGGLTIGLDLARLSIPDILSTFNSKLNNQKLKDIAKYMSGELFSLSLIEKTWSRVVIPPEDPKPAPRLFHELIVIDNKLYFFGGLVVNEEGSNCSLTPANDLWQFDLESKRWTQLFDGKLGNIEPRFCHKMTIISSLSFAGKPDHLGIFIAGGKDKNSELLYDNLVFDLVDKKFIEQPSYLTLKPNDPNSGNFANVTTENQLNIDYFNSIIVNINNQYNKYFHGELTDTAGESTQSKNKDLEESLVVYSPMRDVSKATNPLLSFKLTKSIKSGKVLPVHRKANHETHTNQIMPYNLRYPTGGLFGQNLVITGFLPNEYDISIFIFNRPTGKWSRLNVFCNHDYGSHRFWGGYAWQSHHKVVLIGNYVTSRTTSAIRYFSCMITVSLPITTILASSEMATEQYHTDEDGNRIYLDELHRSATDDSGNSSSSVSSDTEITPTPNDDDKPLTPPDTSRRPSHASRGSRGSVSTSKSPRAISFSEYVHYAAPTTNFTTIRSVLPPAAITLGRNFLDRFGDLIADFEIISVSGDRIPVSLMVLIERWGTYFIELLARGYVSAVEKFDQGQKLSSVGHRLFSKGGTSVSTSSTQRTQAKSSLASSHASSFSSENNNSMYSSNSNQGFNFNENDDPKSEKSYHLSIPIAAKKAQREAPLFRLPFQDTASSSSLEKTTDQSFKLPIDPYGSAPPGPLAAIGQVQPRKDSISSFSSNSSLFNSNLQDIPPQLPLPTEQIPPVPSNPSSFKSNSRRNSTDMASPRGSLIHTLTALRSIPLTKSPRGSPFASPRASVSQQGGGSQNLGMSTPPDMANSPIPSLKPTPMATNSSSSNSGGSPGTTTPTTDQSKVRRFQTEMLGLTESIPSTVDDNDSNNHTEEHDEDTKDNTGLLDNALLNLENLENGTFQMESSLIPRKLYIPLATTSIKAFCEYLYTGQIGNKWLLTPTTLDCLVLAKHYRVPLLYDLISEVLYGIIGRRETWVIKKHRQLKAAYFDLLDETNMPMESDVEFPLDEYEGFMDTVDDGYLDIALLKKSMKRQDNVFSSVPESRKSSRKSSRQSSTFDEVKLEEKSASAPPETKVESPEKDAGTDSSFDNLESSNSETDEIDFGGGYLNIAPEMPNMGPRSKSIFDRGDIDPTRRNKSDTSGPFEEKDTEHSDKDIEFSLTLEQLVSPISPIPTLTIIDLIFETVNYVADLKLILRVYNVKRMSRFLTTCEEDLNKRMQNIRNRYQKLKDLEEARKRAEQADAIRKESGSPVSSVSPRMPALPRGSSYDSDYKLRPVNSSSSLATVGSRFTTGSLSKVPTMNDTESIRTTGQSPISSSEPHSTNGSFSAPQMERARTNSSLRTVSGIQGLTPFKPLKTDPKLQKAETNREIDRRITKLIRRDDKLKQKAEKENKQRDQQRQKLEKKSKPNLSRVSSKFFDDSGPLDIPDNASVSSAGSKKQKHGIFHHMGLGHKRDKPKPSDEPASNLENTSIHSDNSKKKMSLFGIKK